MYPLSDELLRRRAYGGPILVGFPIAAATAWILWDEAPRSVSLALPALLFLSGVLCGALIPTSQKRSVRIVPNFQWLMISGGVVAFVLAGTIASSLTIAFVAFSMALPIFGWMSVRALRELRRRKRAKM